MKVIISKLLMHRRISFAFLFLMLINSFAFAQRKSYSSLTLDTNCIFNNEPVLIDFDIDSDELIEADNKSYTIVSIDSLRFVSLMKSAAYFLDTSKNTNVVNLISDAKLVVNGKNFHYLYTSDFQMGGGLHSTNDTSVFYGVLPSYLGFISKLNLVSISTVYLNDSYATNNLVDVVSGKIIPDLSSFDNGTIAYMPNISNDYIVSYSNSIFEEEESEIAIVKVEYNNKKYCLDLSVIFNLKKQHITELSWINKKSFCFASVKKFEGLEQSNYYLVTLD